MSHQDANIETDTLQSHTHNVNNNQVTSTVQQIDSSIQSNETIECPVPLPFDNHAQISQVASDPQQTFGIVDEIMSSSIERALAQVNLADYQVIPDNSEIHAFFAGVKAPPVHQVQNDTRPYVKILANGYECLPLLDSGSMACIIVYQNENELKPFNGKIEPCNTKVSTVNKENTKCTGVMFIEYTYCGKTVILPTLLLKGDRSLFIVGINFWKAFGIRFSWDEDSIPEVNLEPKGKHESKPTEAAVIDSSIVNIIHDKKPKGMLSLYTTPDSKRYRRYVPKWSSQIHKSIGQMHTERTINKPAVQNAYTAYDSVENESTNDISSSTEQKASSKCGPTLALLDMLKGMPTSVRINEVAIQSNIRTAEGPTDTINDITPEKHSCVSQPHKLTSGQQAQLNEVMAMFPFTPTEGPLNKTNVYVQRINTGDAAPTRARQYPLSPYVIQEIELEVQKLIEKDIVEAIDFSPWRSPILWVKKKTGGGRIVVDARTINKLAVVDAYPTLNVDVILRNLPKAKYISCLDMSMAFHQIEIHPEDRIKTSFVVGHKFYCFKRAIMGFCNSAADLAKVLDKVFGDLMPNVYHYVDDFVVVSSSFEEHIQLLKTIAERMKKVELTVSREKSSFCFSQVTFLGYILTKEGLQANLERVRPILEYPRPRTVKEMRRWVGLVGWYRRFIANAAELLAPLTDLMKGESKAPIQWNEEAEMAFINTKRALLSPAILASPDYSLPFKIYTDASLIAGAAVLTQVQNGDERVIAFHSVKFSKTQQNYSATERECLAVISGIEKFRPYIDGVPFTVVTDHSSLRWLQNLKEPHGKLARWAVRLQAFDITFVHRPGRLMTVPDALSRAVDMIELEIPVKTSDKWYINSYRFARTGKAHHFKLENGILYRRGKYSVTNGNRVWTVCIPKEKVNEVLKEKHDEQAHVGFWKTIRSIKETYYWPEMHQNVYDYVRHCTTCKQIKPSTENTQSFTGKYIDPIRTGRILSIDLVGPLPPSKYNKHMWLMVGVDAFSRYVFAKSCVRATAHAITEWLEKDVFFKFYVPEIVVSDNGTQFTSEWFANFMRSYRIKHKTTPVYHPQANQVESSNKSLKQMLRADLLEKCDHSDWAHYIQKVVMRLNTIPRGPVGRSPHEIVFGLPKTMTGDEHKLLRDVNPPLGCEEERKEAMNEEVAARQREQFEINRKKHDLRARVRLFKPGDLVYVKIHKHSDAGAKYTQKLAPIKRQAIVKEVLGNVDAPNTYLLMDLQQKILGKFHASDMYTI